MSATCDGPVAITLSLSHNFHEMRRDNSRDVVHR
jgi:hypothetical protein